MNNLRVDVFSATTLLLVKYIQRIRRKKASAKLCYRVGVSAASAPAIPAPFNWWTPRWMGLVGAALKMKRDLFISWNLSVKLQGLFLTHLNPWGPIKGDSRSGLFTSRCYRRWNMRPLFFFHSNGPKNERLDGKWTKQSAVNSMCDYNGFLNEKQNIHHWRKIIIAITAFNLSY